ncbi:MAG: hypothetical protein IJS99_10115 [Synergistaceae bacterium]|nr:hypothetical protein [Synergistaceae bacterium]
MKKFFVLIIILVSLCSITQADEYYYNRFEFSNYDKILRVSFKGAFRSQDSIVFCFIVYSKEDMIFRADNSEIFDDKGNKFIDSKWLIGREETRMREIIADVPIKAECYINMPRSESEFMPVIARVSFNFNGQWHELRNIQVQNWREWEDIKRAAGIK